MCIWGRVEIALGIPRNNVPDGLVVYFVQRRDELFGDGICGRSFASYDHCLVPSFGMSSQ